MIAFTLLLALGFAGALSVLFRRVGILEQELARVESLLASARAPVAPPAESTASAPLRAEARPAPVVPESAEDAALSPEPEPAPEAPARASLESLIGGRLPIWIGGAALVLAGFFLVRYSIESGLIGPAARTVLAALFGLALVAAGEAARRLSATAADPRIAQVLAGAGVASLYGTLYMAAALYHLVAPLSAFVLVLLVTAGALALALRHGPPTAVMALVGGFVAPLLAGFDAAGVGALLVYLALFTAALFGLAIHRGWGWLALAASAAGFGWINFLIMAFDGRGSDLAGVGGFTMLLAAGASAALPAAGVRSASLRLAPLLAGLVQLVLLAPALDFGPLAWGLYLVLAAATLFLAWREPRYLPGALAALGLLLVLQVLALLAPERNATPLAAIAAALLFAVPGQAFARRAHGWAALALGGSAGPLLVAHACAPSLLPSFAWGALELAAAGACARIAWEFRTQQQGRALPGATLIAAIAATIGMAQFVPDGWLSVPLAATIVALGLWARRAGAPGLFVLPALPAGAALLAAPLLVMALVELVFASATGDRLPYRQLPDAADLLRAFALPVFAILGLLADPRQFGPLRRGVGASAAAVALLLAYALAKQLLAIDTPDRFLAYGFVERALLTQACLASGWLLLRRGQFLSLAGALVTLGLCRLVWFDCVLLNPVLVAQSVGGLPLANAATLHVGLAAFWFWTLPARPPLRLAAMLLTAAALLVTVRQAARGTLLTGPVGNLENGGYSAALIVLALFWLWRGIVAGARDLRIAGLVLLTLATFKVFLVDAAALDGVLRILSFLGLGVALIGIGWAYGRFLGRGAPAGAG